MGTEAAISAAALVIVRKLSLVKGRFLPLKRSMLDPPVAATKHELRSGLIPDLLFFALQTVRKIATAERSEITVASHRLDISTPSPIGKVAIRAMRKKTH